MGKKNLWGRLRQTKGIIFALRAKIILFPAVVHVIYALGEGKEIYRGTEQKNSLTVLNHPVQALNG